MRSTVLFRECGNIGYGEIGTEQIESEISDALRRITNAATALGLTPNWHTTRIELVPTLVEEMSFSGSKVRATYGELEITVESEEEVETEDEDD